MTLDDVMAAAAAITSHLERGPLADGLVFDAVRVQLIEIGEAVKGIDPDTLGSEPAVPWQDVAGMRDHLAHRSFDSDHAIVAATVNHDLPPLVAAVERLRNVAAAPDYREPWQPRRQRHPLARAFDASAVPRPGGLVISGDVRPGGSHLPDRTSTD